MKLELHHDPLDVEELAYYLAEKIWNDGQELSHDDIHALIRSSLSEFTILKWDVAQLLKRKGYNDAIAELNLLPDEPE